MRFLVGDRLICASLDESRTLETAQVYTKTPDTCIRCLFLLYTGQSNEFEAVYNKNTELLFGVFVCLVARERLELSTFGL